MREIPQKGWCVVKEDGTPTIEGTKVYLDGKLVGGIRKLSLEIDAEKLIPILKLEVVAWEGMTVDTVFGPPTRSPNVEQEPLVFRSTSSPEDILKAATAKETEQDEIL